MPGWIQIVLAIAGLLTALGVIWVKIKTGVRRTARFIYQADEMLPLLRDLTEEFKGNPHVFEVLGDIAAQFRTDSGSTLKDQVNRIEKDALELKHAADEIAIHAKANAILAERDRKVLDQLTRLIDILGAKVDAGAESNQRIEAAAEVVAVDLAASQERADEATGPHGAAADAFGQSPKPTE